MPSPAATTAESIVNPFEDVTSTPVAQSQDTQSIGMPAARDTVAHEVPVRARQPQTGDRLGTYVLQDKLGSGVSCHVFRAWDEAKACPVAMKIINWANVIDREAALKQMRTEAAALARIKHPRVLRFIDFGYDPRWPYLVTEFVDGRPLGELIRTGGALPLEWSLFLLGQVIDGLGAVWRAGIVHRDIKPDNILIGASGVAKLIDFGVARVDILKSLEADDAASIEMAGTAAYVAPEQARNATEADVRSDIYSLGVTFYELMTGKLPFEARNRMQMIFQHLNTPPTPPSKVNPKIPQLASDLCLWMLAKSADERPQHFQDLKDGLQTVQSSLTKSLA
jgi:serine/threonine protein kinase